MRHQAPRNRNLGDFGVVEGAGALVVIEALLMELVDLGEAAWLFAARRRVGALGYFVGSGVGYYGR